MMLVRFTLTLGAIAALVMPTAAGAMPARTDVLDTFQRPSAHVHGINAILGDASFVHRFGQLPPPGTDPSLRVRTHLEFVHRLLSRRDAAQLPPELRQARVANLERLREYIDAEAYPRNFLFPRQNRPCFIDRDGRICAVGYLVEQSAGREMAEQINARFQSEFLWKMDLPELRQWVEASGLSLLELSMIQPGYAPTFDLEFAWDSDRAPATVSITGDVADDQSLLPCDTKIVELDFGDGSTWDTGIVNEFRVVVETTHTYECPGTYTIRATATPEDGCGYQPVWQEWQFTLNEPTFTLQAHPAPGAPLGVFLTTADDVRLDHLTTASIVWGDGSPPEDAGWFVSGPVLQTPAHSYPGDGPFTAEVTHTYTGADCSFQQSASVQVITGIATETTSWGCIKAKFEAEG